MTTDYLDIAAKATQALVDIRTQYDAAHADGVALDAERDYIAFGALAARDKAAAQRLDALNGEKAANDVLLANLTSAIKGAEAAVDTAHRHCAASNSRTAANANMDKAERLRQLAKQAADGIKAHVAAMAEIKRLANELLPASAPKRTRRPPNCVPTKSSCAAKTMTARARRWRVS